MRKRKILCSVCLRDGKHTFPETISETEIEKTLRCPVCANISVQVTAPRSQAPVRRLFADPPPEPEPEPEREDIFAIWENAGRKKMEGR